MSPKRQKEYDADIIGFSSAHPDEIFHEEGRTQVCHFHDQNDKKSAHKIDKLAPTNDCKSNGKKATKSESYRLVAAGEMPGHKKPNCQEPSYEQSARTKRPKGLVNESNLTRLFNSL
jgi:hypothetical protein